LDYRLFPLIIRLLVDCRVTSEYTSDLSTVKNQAEVITQALSQKIYLLPTAFISFAHPSADSLFTTNELDFNQNFGAGALGDSIASLVGVWLFNASSKPSSESFGYRPQCFMTMLLLVTHSNRALGIDDHWFSLTALS